MKENSKIEAKTTLKLEVYECTIERHMKSDKKYIFELNLIENDKNLQ